MATQLHGEDVQHDCALVLLSEVLHTWIHIFAYFYTYATSAIIQTFSTLSHSQTLKYCSISFNSAPSVMRYQPAEILISAGPRFERDMQIFSVGRGKFCAKCLQILHC